MRQRGGGREAGREGEREGGREGQRRGGGRGGSQWSLLTHWAYVTPSPPILPGAFRTHLEHMHRNCTDQFSAQRRTLPLTSPVTLCLAFPPL